MSNMHHGSKTQPSSKSNSRQVASWKKPTHFNHQNTNSNTSTSPNLKSFAFQKVKTLNSGVAWKKPQNATGNKFGRHLGTNTVVSKNFSPGVINWDTKNKFAPNAHPTIGSTKFQQAKNNPLTKHQIPNKIAQISPRTREQPIKTLKPVINKNVQGDRVNKNNATTANVKGENVNNGVKNVPPEGNNMTSPKPSPVKKPPQGQNVTTPITAKERSSPPPQGAKSNPQSPDSAKSKAQSSGDAKAKAQSSEGAKSSAVCNASSRKEISEIYKNSTVSNASSENMDLQKVTQDLANIIKNFQKQIQEVHPLSNEKLEDIPSALIRPKNKEFFQSTKQQVLDKNNKPENKTPPPPNNNQVKSNTQTNKPEQRKSLRNMNVKSSSIRRFTSSTHHALSIKSSSSSRHGIAKRASSLNVDPLKHLKEEVQRAIRTRKTFTVRGQFVSVRRALLDRGWIEKYHISYKDTLHEDMKRYFNYSIIELLPLLRCEGLTNTCKNLIKSKLLGGYQVDFYWSSNNDAFKENPDKIKLTAINKLKREIFSYTNKQGLCEANKNSYWYQKPNVSKLNHPRCYSLGKTGDLKEFIDDFNITAAMSLLKWIVKISVTKECKLLSPTGKIPLETFDFAINECCKFVKKGKHEDIDLHITDATEHEWDQFLDYFYKLVHYNNHFKCERSETEESMVRKSNYVLNSLRRFYPYVDMDGMFNIWILKPTTSSRGRGIHMCRSLQYALRIIKQNANVRYIIQKYIERPLLIYNTKFDIRQWFLISNCSPLTIWAYKECYLRFSSQTYNLRKLHESIHLTNNSVQSKYKNDSVDSALPSYNMWDSHDFQKYLTNIGYPNAYKSIIYPGMKQSITAAVLMHQDKMVVRKNCFELFGADFILTEDFQPWLLEINSNPALYGSTPVTARMCPKVLDDVIKVVVDFAHNNKANTGEFELIYKEQLCKLPPSGNLEVKGLPLKRSYFSNDQELNGVKKQESIKRVPVNKSAVVAHQDSFKNFGEDIKKTLKSLLEIIQSERQRRGLKQQQNLKTAVAAVK